MVEKNKNKPKRLGLAHFSKTVGFFVGAANAPSVNNPTARVQIPSPIPRYALFGQTVECLVLDPLPKIRL